MHNGHADGVKEHKNDDEPIELLRLDEITYPKSEPFLSLPEL